MKSILISILMGAVVLLGISSCATVPTEPLGEGGLRLLEMEVPENGNLRMGASYESSIRFEADGKPEIIGVVCFYSGNGPYFFKVQSVEYGSQANFSIHLRVYDTGSQRLECYANYVSDGKRKRSNSVSSLIFGISL
jgi:hypothetical protein